MESRKNDEEDIIPHQARLGLL